MFQEVFGLVRLVEKGCRNPFFWRMDMRKVFPVWLLFLVSCSSEAPVTQGTADPEVLSRAMAELGVKELRSLPCGDQKAKVVKTEVEGFKFGAIVYESSRWKDDYPARTFSGSRVEEIRLILEGKIPHTWKGGNWLLPKKVGVAEKFDYLSLGPNTRVEEAFRLPDGRVVKHVIPQGSCPYFAVETPQKVRVKDAMAVTLYPVEVEGKVRFPTASELSDAGVVPPGAKIIKTLASSETSGCGAACSKVVLVEWETEKTLWELTIYPYYVE